MDNKNSFTDFFGTLLNQQKQNKSKAQSDFESLMNCFHDLKNNLEKTEKKSEKDKRENK